ncbi:hypothetical protein HDU67_009314 [Dinochytrium kinnereticum]|nr:hypothetical protein HDU67_009314 [Dinochytrium kinnereticum]
MDKSTEDGFRKKLFCQHHAVAIQAIKTLTQKAIEAHSSHSQDVLLDLLWDAIVQRSAVSYNVVLGRASASAILDLIACNAFAAEKAIACVIGFAPSASSESLAILVSLTSDICILLTIDVITDDDKQTAGPSVSGTLSTPSQALIDLCEKCPLAWKILVDDLHGIDFSRLSRVSRRNGKHRGVLEPKLGPEVMRGLLPFFKYSAFKAKSHDHLLDVASLLESFQLKLYSNSAVLDLLECITWTLKHCKYDELRRRLVPFATKLVVNIRFDDIPSNPLQDVRKSFQTLVLTVVTVAVDTLSGNRPSLVYFESLEKMLTLKPEIFESCKVPVSLGLEYFIYQSEDETSRLIALRIASSLLQSYVSANLRIATILSSFSMLSTFKFSTEMFESTIETKLDDIPKIWIRYAEEACLRESFADELQTALVSFSFKSIDSYEKKGRK